MQRFPLESMGSSPTYRLRCFIGRHRLLSTVAGVSSALILGLLLGLQAMINMGVNMGMLPTKGLTLPFVSYGGSSLLVCCLAAGILLRIERDTRGQHWGDR